MEGKKIVKFKKKRSQAFPKSPPHWKKRNFPV